MVQGIGKNTNGDTVCKDGQGYSDIQAETCHLLLYLARLQFKNEIEGARFHTFVTEKAAQLYQEWGYSPLQFLFHVLKW